MYNKLDIKKGDRFGNWKVIKEVKGKYGRRFLCINDRMLEKEVDLVHLRGGKSKGHYGYGENSPTRTHGMSNTRIWNIWQKMKQRCFDKNDTGYKSYGARGITVCKKWLKFEGFYEDMKEGYTNLMTIERIDVNESYEKLNCKWIPKSEQGLNTTRTIHLFLKGKKYSLSELSEKFDIKYITLYSRLFKNKLPIEEAVKKDRMKRKKLQDLINK